MQTLKRADMAVGIFVALFGIFILLASISITGGVAARLPPRTFPVVIGCLLLVCGAALAIKSWTLKDEGPRVEWPDKTGFRTIVIVLFALACYIALVDRIGMPIATFLYTAFSIWFLNRKRWCVALIIGVISGLLLHYLFIRVLGLSLPMGPLFE